MNISVVIVSYNSEKFLENNLHSLTRQTVKFKQIVVVDNHSADDSLQVIENFKNDVDIIKLSFNSGYATAANIGIKNTDSHLLLVANADIILDENFNAAVLGKFRENKDIAMLSPLMLRFDRRTVDSAGQACSLALYPCEIGFNRDIEDITSDERPVFSVCGAATVFSREALERLKINDEYYDEDFFIFWEDFDIGWRAHLLGLKTLFYPKAVVYHYRSGTLKQNFLSRFSLALARPAAIKYHLVKNRYLTLIKNFRFKQNIKSIPFIFFKDIIWVSLLTFFSPKIIIPLMKSGKYIKKAFKKRKQVGERMRNPVSASPQDQQPKDPNE
ncbi:MAG: glycosyltransferase family 2 protein [Candidatus Aminicenantes bacterium]